MTKNLCVRNKVVRQEYEDVENSTNLAELHQNLQHAQARVQSLGVIKFLRAEVDAVDDEVHVTVHAKDPTPNYSCGANCNQAGEAAFELKADVPAIFGGNSSLSASTRSPSFKWFRSHESSLRLFTPRFFVLGQYWTASLDMLSAKTDMSQYSSYTEALQSINCSLLRGPHAIHIETYSLRDLMPSLPAASVAIQSARQRSIKTSVKYSWTQIQRWTQKIQVEAAGLWGDARFLKGDAVIGRTINLPNDFDISVIAGGGYLFPLDGKETCLQDRFFLGGPSGCANILKGFHFRGAGPVDARQHGVVGTDATGGDMFGTVWGSLGRAIQYGGNTGRVFAFANAGLLGSPTPAQITALKPADVAKLGEHARFSAGVGVSVSLPIGGSVELTAAFPVGKPTDVTQRFQLGLRLEC
eukprot:GEMP01043915.1.p1 GENE.GEMP01043915.1~~GEMP01043915.1.p1  ORF type:complete len:412 (+),score=89.11 GEMP01043915.1:166-1401(+)